MTQTVRIIDTAVIEAKIIEMIFEASFHLLPEVEGAFSRILKEETADPARMTMEILMENARFARDRQLPLCQDCGSVTVFIEMGQQVCLSGLPLQEAVDHAVAAAYEQLYLRKSIVGDPLKRKNTGTNTPAFIHTDIVPGDRLKMSVYLKGGGSENMTVLKMFRPTDSVETIISFIEESVAAAGPNPCPPLFLGVGIGGTADAAMLNSRKAVLRGIGTRHHDKFYADLEARILGRLNGTGVGPLGFGGRGTAAAVFIREAPAHIASLPVALNFNCHSLRYRTVEL
jgi:fumarate hydratase subunit alpha